MIDSKYRHLFFDLDHTLWDFEGNAQKVIFSLLDHFELAKSGITDPAEFFGIFSEENNRLWERYRNGFMRQDELRYKRFWNSLLRYKIADAGLARNMSEVYIAQLPEQDQLLPYARDILDYCRAKGYRLHIITNGFEEVQHRKMRNAGIQDYFIEVITSERSMSLKPKKEIFDFALEVTGAQIEESIMIGDSWEADIKGAMAAGWEQIYYNPRADTPALPATFEIHCLSQLKEIF
ncbi:MAG: YjjG family noncanonical pyrimidine nucleotidase [Taibaiella sp.]|nr:YjjG family noncanonical pyrimidine nucleotidase [Taibaiella sp.]